MGQGCGVGALWMALEMEYVTLSVAMFLETVLEFNRMFQRAWAVFCIFAASANAVGA